MTAKKMSVSTLHLLRFPSLPSSSGPLHSHMEHLVPSAHLRGTSSFPAVPQQCCLIVCSDRAPSHSLATFDLQHREALRSPPVVLPRGLQTMSKWSEMAKCKVARNWSRRCMCEEGATLSIFGSALSAERPCVLLWWVVSNLCIFLFFQLFKPKPVKISRCKLEWDDSIQFKMQPLLELNKRRNPSYTGQFLCFVLENKMLAQDITQSEKKVRS